MTPQTNTERLRSQIMASVHSKGNRSTEVKLRMLMVRAHITGWRLLPTEILGNPDFIFPGLRIAIFVDGCFWHGCPRCYRRPSSNQNYWDAKVQRNRDRDRRQRSKLRREGWHVLSIWEHELRSPVKVLRKINAAIDRCGR